MNGLIFLFSTVFVVYWCIPPCWSFNNNTLLLICSFDGFRYDYIYQNATPTLLNLKRKGSSPPYMNPIYPSLTLPNHASITTGLYAETHGVLDNKLYDKKTNKFLEYGYDIFHYNDDVVPVWIQNERAGRGHTSGCMTWPGCQFKYQDSLPTYSYNIPFVTPWKYRIEIMMRWFTDEKNPANLVMAHFENPDEACHLLGGPDSEGVNRALSNVDDLVKYMLKRFEEEGLQNRINIMFVSDHGCVHVHQPDYLIYLDKYVDPTSYIRSGESTSAMIFPVEGKEAEVLEALKKGSQESESHFTTYSRPEIPERFHYKNCDRTPPILLTAELGYLFDGDIYNFELGQHGYDPDYQQMKSFFLAIGPLFKTNFEMDPFENIHIYPLVAYILDLPPPAVPPNGTLSVLQGILSNSETKPEEKRGSGTKPEEKRGSGTKLEEKCGSGTKPEEKRGSGTKPEEKRGSETRPEEKRGSETLIFRA